MARIGREQWGWLRIGAFLLLSHLLFLAPSASAGCRHPGAFHPERWSIAFRLETVLDDDAFATVPDPSAVEAPKGEAPQSPSRCSGPGCSSRDPEPASSAVSDTDLHNRWGDLDELAFTPCTSSWSRRLEAPKVRPIGGKPSIFHPPPGD